MAKLSYANQQFLLKPEAVYGTETAVVGADFRRMNTLRIDPQDTFEVDAFLASGQTAPSLGIVNDEFSEGDIEGRADYNSIVYPLASLFGAPASTEEDVGVRYEHVFTYDGLSPLVPLSYTLSYGQSGAGNSDKILGWIFNAFGLSGGRGGFDLSSSGFGKAMTEGVALGTLHATVGDVSPVPVAPLHGSIFLDTAAAGLGTTRLLDVYSADIAFGERMARARPINALLTSDGVVEMADQEHTVELQFGVDAVERARFAKLRAGVKEFVRVAFVGSVLGTGTYSITMDFCLIWTESGATEDTDSVLTRTWTGRIARDSTWGKAAVITVNNALSDPGISTPV